MNQIPQIIQTQNQTLYFLDSKPYKLPTKDRTPHTASPSTPSNNMSHSHSHSLKLKDYLRLTTLNKRSNSSSSNKGKSADTTRVDTPSKNSGLLDTQKSLSILKEELKSDLKVCMDKIGELLQKVDKSEPTLNNSEADYDELVFLCELHRTIKQNIKGHIDKANTLVSEHKQKQIFKFSAKARELISEDIKKTTTPKKRSSLYVSCWRPHFLENSEH